MYRPLVSLNGTSGSPDDFEWGLSLLYDCPKFISKHVNLALFAHTYMSTEFLSGFPFQDFDRRNMVELP